MRHLYELQENLSYFRYFRSVVTGYVGMKWKKIWRTERLSMSYWRKVWDLT